MGATGRRDNRSIHLPPPFPADSVKQYRFPSPLECFPADAIYNPLLAASGVYPRGLLPAGRCSANFQLRWLQPSSEKERTTPLLLRFSTARIFQRPDQQIKCFGSCVSFPFYHNTQITLICSYFFEKTARDAFRLVPPGARPRP